MQSAPHGLYHCDTGRANERRVAGLRKRGEEGRADPGGFGNRACARWLLRWQGLMPWIAKCWRAINIPIAAPSRRRPIERACNVIARPSESILSNYGTHTQQERSMHRLAAIHVSRLPLQFRWSGRHDQRLPKSAAIARRWLIFVVRRGALN